MTIKRVLADAALVLFCVLPISSSSGASMDTPADTSVGATVEVAVQDYRFQPAEVQVKVGDTVKWVNKEKRTSHSVTFSANEGGESERFFPGESWQRVFNTPGRYSYHCGPHPEMVGAVVVLPP